MANTPYSQEYPLGTPAVNGNALTVDLMLKEPTRINAYLSNVALYGYFAEKIFTNAGGVSGGALVYSQLTTNDLFPTRRAQRVEPGAEFPEVTFDRPEPKTAQVEKIGGKYSVTDEARDRNDLTEVQNETTKLGNDIQDQLHTRALNELDAAISSVGAPIQMTTSSWADAAALTLTTTANSLLPAADLAEMGKRAANQRLGTRYNLLIVNPQEFANFHVIYGDRANAILAANGIEEMIATPLVNAGEGYAIQRGLVGQVRYEQPVGTTTYREEGREVTWVKSSVRAVFAVTNPYNVLKLTGLAA
ncbi:MAG: major capsid protein [Mycobacterium sp.]